jgi:ribose 5-phosphate isomerase B|tara:strand:- start:1215 stop:1649 length:435 start_codon:yes stop_codon:yes gene_type:complete
MKIAIGNDHAGVEVKRKIESYLSQKGHEVINKGYDGKEKVDYPDFIHPVSLEVKEKKAQIGVIICGSGNGAAMTANKHKGIRAAICWSEEIAELARKHNNANIISIPSRFLSEEEIINITETFITTNFEGGRHKRRIEKIDEND